VRLVVYSTNETVQVAVGNLSSKLNEISGATFSTNSGSTERSILIGLPGDFTNLPPALLVDRFEWLDPKFNRETYSIFSTSNALYLIGKSFDGDDYTDILWPAGLRNCVESGIDTEPLKNFFYQHWTLYFYVPKNTAYVGEYAENVYEIGVSGTLKDSDETIRLDFTGQGNGWFYVQVPPGRTANSGNLKIQAACGVWLPFHPTSLQAHQNCCFLKRLSTSTNDRVPRVGMSS